MICFNFHTACNQYIHICKSPSIWRNFWKHQKLLSSTVPHKGFVNDVAFFRLYFLFYNILFYHFSVRLRRSNTLGRYDRPRSIHGDHVPTSNGLFSSLSSSTTSSSSMLNVCLDCKKSVEVMTKSTPSPNSKIDHQAPQVPFHQRRHSSLSHHHQFQHRRSLVTRSMYLDNEY